jgi:hypothetical protein
MCVAGPWRLGFGIVGSEDFEGARVACCSGGGVRLCDLRGLGSGELIHRCLGEVVRDLAVVEDLRTSAWL